MGNSLSRKDIISLVHHIELNKAGWWDKGIQQLIYGTIWLLGKSMTMNEVIDELRNTYAVKIDAVKASQQFDALCDAGKLIPLGNDRFKVSESGISELEYFESAGQGGENPLARIHWNS